MVITLIVYSKDSKELFKITSRENVSAEEIARFIVDLESNGYKVRKRNDT